jgi:hypothetical protein
VQVNTFESLVALHFACHSQIGLTSSMENVGAISKRLRVDYSSQYDVVRSLRPVDCYTRLPVPRKGEKFAGPELARWLAHYTTPMDSTSAHLDHIVELQVRCSLFSSLPALTQRLWRPPLHRTPLHLLQRFFHNYCYHWQSRSQLVAFAIVKALGNNPSNAIISAIGAALNQGPGARLNFTITPGSINQCKGQVRAQ